MKKLLFLLLAFSVCYCLGGVVDNAIAQTKPEICDNGVDDDDDKLVDCADPDCDCTTTEICDNGVDDDGDKLVDCADSDCKCEPEGEPCSPGYWKNHLDHFNQVCGAAAALDPGDSFPDCASILTALECKGSDASCKRSAAAALMNRVSGCVE